MKISILGIDRETRISSGVFTLWNNQWVLFAVLVGAFAVVLPFIRFALLSVALACVRSSWRPSWFGRAYRFSLQLDTWAMPDVLLLGAAVGYSRIDARIPVHIGSGGICFILAAVSAMLCRATLDRRSVWRDLIDSLVNNAIMVAPAEGEPWHGATYGICRTDRSAASPSAAIAG